MADFIIFLISCNEICTRPLILRIVSLFYCVIVGGASLSLTLIKLFKNRLACLNILKRSNISASLLYRMMGGITVLIIIGSLNIVSILADAQKVAVQLTDMEKIASVNIFDPTSLIGLGFSIVIGSGAEALQLWRTWIKTYLGIDLTPNNNKTMNVGAQQTKPGTLNINESKSVQH